MWPLVFLTACNPGSNPPADIPQLVDLQPPTIETISLECQAERERWRLDVETAFWTGGGRLYLTPDGEYIESHAVNSIAAEPDGTADKLRVDLSIVGDFRDVAANSTTAMTCATDPFALFVLYDTDGETVSDCRYWAPLTWTWSEIDGLPDCEESAVPEDSGDTGS